MNSFENHLRTALGEIADELPAYRVPPLQLPRGSFGRSGGESQKRRLRRTLAPLAAAASVLTITAGAVTAARLAHPAPRTRPGLMSDWQRSRFGRAGIPPYFAAIRQVQVRCCHGRQISHLYVDVRSTATGATIASVTPPSPYVSILTVSAASDDRTFVFGAMTPSRWENGIPVYTTRFFRLRINPDAASQSQRAQLSALPVIEPSGTRIWGYALSPDGAELAVDVTGRLTESGDGLSSQLQVHNLVTGTERTWAYVGDGEAGLSWEADNRTLALTGSFQPFRASSSWPFYFLLVDTAAPGSSLAADARVALRIHGAISNWVQAVITPDGRSVLAVQDTGRFVPDATLSSERVGTYDALTGRLEGVISDSRISGTGGVNGWVLWSSPSGRLLIVSRAGWPYRHVEFYADGHFTPVPWWTGAAAW